ncbi:MAG: lipid II:glycine glycyltransferase FemX [Candidatus Acidiferrales bacterium]
MNSATASIANDVNAAAAIRGQDGAKLTAYAINPLTDSRWTPFLAGHPRATVFHSAEWLEALRRTYGYTPVAYTSSRPDEDLRNALLFCRVESWLTGRRLVSLPFSDYCEPLLESPADLQVLFSAAEKQSHAERCRYVEIRPLGSVEISTSLRRATEIYTFHELDLKPDLDTLFRNFHKNSTQRKIRRAEREGLTYRNEPASALLDSFYKLLIMTRGRHHLPPQPKIWFRNLVDCMGDALKIRVAFKDGKPVAGMLTLCYKQTFTYKYGCSDSRFNHLGGMHLLFWKSIQEAKNSEMSLFDFGRTDAGQTGLITFKGRWGAAQSELVYSRYAAPGDTPAMLDPAGPGWKVRCAKRIFARMPASALSVVGRLLYKHIG